MKYLPLTNSNKKVIIDNEQYLWLSQHKWYLIGSKESGYVGQTVYNQKTKKCHQVKLHKVLLWCPKGYMIDHINGNRFDNRLNILRIVTSQQNSLNRRKTVKKRKSKFKGVSTWSSSKKWIAQISKKGKYQYLGSFKTEKEAALKEKQQCEKWFFTKWLGY